MRKLFAAVLAAFILNAEPSWAQFHDQATWGGTAGGTANAVTVTIPNVSALADIVGVPIRFIVSNTNTASTTFSVIGASTLTPTIIKKATVGGLVALSGNEMPAAAVVSVTYDGTEFVLTGGGFAQSQPVLSAPQTYYVSTTGSDSNNCLTSGTACATVNHVISLVQALNMNGYNVTINVASGTYTTGIAGGTLNGSGTLYIIGNISSPSSVVISPPTGEAIAVSGQNYVFEGFTLVTSAAGSPPHIGACVRAGAGSNIVLYDVALGPCYSSGIQADPNSFTSVYGTGYSGYINLVGNMPYVASSTGGSILFGQTNVNITPSTFTFTDFFLATNIGQIVGPLGTVTISGSVSGTKYNASLNGIINMGGACSSLPGTGGSTSTGGQCN